MNTKRKPQRAGPPTVSPRQRPDKRTTKDDPAYRPPRDRELQAKPKGDGYETR